MNGKITTSRMGIMGSRLVSVLSFVVTIFSFYADCPTNCENKNDATVIPEGKTAGSEFFGSKIRELAGLFEHSHIDLLGQDHLLRDHKLTDLLEGGEIVHQVQHQVFQDHPEASSSNLALHGKLRNRLQGVFTKLELNILKLEQLLILPDNRVLRPGENLNQRFLRKILEHSRHRHSPYKLRNKAVLDQVYGLALR